ncbi:MAG TPA: vWA domain-containing protein, partial [Chthoniobacterales bacterium]
MALEFTDPWMLALLPLGWFLWSWQHRSPAPLPPRRRRWSTGLRLTIFALMVLALTDPRWRSSSRQSHYLWMADVSRSVDEKALDRAREIREKIGAAPAGSSESWLLFAGRTAVAADAAAARKIVRKELNDEETNLAGALQFAMASFPVDRGKTALLFTDGVETVGRASDQLRALREAGVRVVSIPIVPPDKPEILVKA